MATGGAVAAAVVCPAEKTPSPTSPDYRTKGLDDEKQHFHILPQLQAKRADFLTVVLTGTLPSRRSFATPEAAPEAPGPRDDDVTKSESNSEASQKSTEKSQEAAPSTLMAEDQRGPKVSGAENDPDLEDASKTLVLFSPGDTRKSPSDGALEAELATPCALTPQLQLEAPDTGRLSPVLRLEAPDTGRLSPALRLEAPDTGRLSPGLRLEAPDTGRLSPALRSDLRPGTPVAPASPPFTKVERTFVHIAETSHLNVMSSNGHTAKDTEVTSTRPAEDPLVQTLRRPSEAEAFREQAGDPLVQTLRRPSEAFREQAGEPPVQTRRRPSEAEAFREQAGDPPVQTLRRPSESEAFREQAGDPPVQTLRRPSEAEALREQAEDAEVSGFMSQDEVDRPQIDTSPETVPPENGPRMETQVETQAETRAETQAETPQQRSQSVAAVVSEPESEKMGRPRLRSRIPVLVSEEESGSERSSSASARARLQHRARHMGLARLVVEKGRWAGRRRGLSGTSSSLSSGDEEKRNTASEEDHSRDYTSDESRSRLRTTEEQGPREGRSRIPRPLTPVKRPVAELTAAASPPPAPIGSSGSQRMSFEEWSRSKALKLPPRASSASRTSSSRTPLRLLHSRFDSPSPSPHRPSRQPTMPVITPRNQALSSGMRRSASQDPTASRPRPKAAGGGAGGGAAGGAGGGGRCTAARASKAPPRERSTPAR